MLRQSRLRRVIQVNIARLFVCFFFGSWTLKAFLGRSARGTSILYDVHYVKKVGKDRLREFDTPVMILQLPV